MDGGPPTARRPEDGIECFDGPAPEVRDARGSTILRLVWTILFPWIGPATHWFTLGRVRSDFWELSGVLLWPAVFCVVGMYFAQQDRKHVSRVAGGRPVTDGTLSVHWGLSAASLVALAIFEGGMVVAMSIYRWNRHERDISVYLFKLCLVIYVAHVVLAIVARHVLRRLEEPVE